MTYLLDANAVISFLDTGHDKDLVTLARTISLAVVAEVKAEVDRRVSRGKRWWESSGIVVHSIPLGSPAHDTLLALGLPDPRGLGERASIAFARHAPSLVFVTSDKNGMYIAFRELYGEARRVTSLAGFLRDARDHGLAWSAVDDVYRESRLPQPTWWADWRAGK